MVRRIGVIIARSMTELYLCAILSGPKSNLSHNAAATQGAQKLHCVTLVLRTKNKKNNISLFKHDMIFKKDIAEIYHIRI